MECRHGLAMRILSVKRVISDKMKESCARILTLHESMKEHLP